MMRPPPVVAKQREVTATVGAGTRPDRNVRRRRDPRARTDEPRAPDRRRLQLLRQQIGGDVGDRVPEPGVKTEGIRIEAVLKQPQAGRLGGHGAEGLHQRPGDTGRGTRARRQRTDAGHRAPAGVQTRPRRPRSPPAPPCSPPDRDPGRPGKARRRCRASETVAVTAAPVDRPEGVEQDLRRRVDIALPHRPNLDHATHIGNLQGSHRQGIRACTPTPPSISKRSQREKPIVSPNWM